MTVTANIELRDPMPSGNLSIFSDWMGQKGKDVCDAAANISFYLSRIPALYGYEVSPAWETSNKAFGDCKKLFAFPAAIKGCIALYDKVVKGGVLARNFIGETTNIFADAMDGFIGFQSFGIMRKTPDLLAHLKLINNFTGLFGLANAAYNFHVDLNLLRQIDLNKMVHLEIKHSEKALKFKRNWINAEIDAKWYERLGRLVKLGVCILGAGKVVVGWAGLAAVNFPWTSTILAGSWTLPLIATVSLYAKYNVHVSKVASGFWQNHYAKLIPT